MGPRTNPQTGHHPSSIAIPDSHGRPLSGFYDPWFSSATTVANQDYQKKAILEMITDFGDLGQEDDNGATIRIMGIVQDGP